MIDNSLIDYAVLHRNEDVARLLLSARDKSIDMSLVAQQIEGWRTACEKWPTLSVCDRAWYPPRLSREQSSSETTARYKAHLFASRGSHMADLTGGMGIDSLMAVDAGATVDYVECDATLCKGMEHNLSVLGVEGCNVHCAESMAWIAASRCTYDTIYIDPARRDAHGGRVSAFEQCTPNLLQHLDMLLTHCRELVVKASPMIDLATAQQQLGHHLRAIHIVAVKGECKEVLFVCSASPADEATTIACVDLRDSTPHADFSLCQPFCFTQQEEAAATPLYCQTMGRYLYEPHSALMKGGPFNLIGERYGLAKLARNSHLYTSDRCLTEFPGRTFEVLQTVTLNAKNIRQVLPEGRAHVVSRNYPLSAEALQQQLKLCEGGDLFVIATTIGRQRQGFLCIKK